MKKKKKKTCRIVQASLLSNRFSFFKTPLQEPYWKDLVDGYRLLSQQELNKFPKPAKLVQY